MSSLRVFIEDDDIARQKLFALLQVPDRLDRIEHLITRILHKETEIMSRTTALLEATARQTTVIASVGQFIVDLKAALVERGIEESEIDAALEGVNANTATAAFFVNTPTPPPVPEG